MDEYIPQLTLTPDLSAQAQPEVKKGRRPHHQGAGRA